mgnify:CR=1 FL=1
MGVSIQDRTDFLNMLDACRTEQQLFSRLTFAVMFHQTDPDAREDLLDDVRGAACNMQLPAVNYKIDQWLNTCKQAWQADPAAFMAAVNADAKQRKLALEGSAAQPGLLADVPMQSVAWLVPQLLPLGEVSLLGADGGTGKGIWQAQLIAYVTAGKTSGFFPLPPQQTGKVLLLAGGDDPGKVLKARLLAAGADMNRGAGADRRRLLWQDRPAPYPQDQVLADLRQAGRCCSSWTRCRAFCPPMWRWQAATRCAVPCCRCTPLPQSRAARCSS